MRKYLCLAFVFCAAILPIGCQTKSETPNTSLSNDDPRGTAAQQLDFEALLAAVDNAIGKRMQSMQMEAMESATYQYDGPIQEVIDIVAPMAKKAGFTEKTGDPANGMGPAALEMQKKMGVKMDSVEHKMFTHEHGEILSVSRMDISNGGIDMKMLTIQLMNPKKMADFGATMQKP